MTEQQPTAPTIATRADACFLLDQLLNPTMEIAWLRRREHAHVESGDSHGFARAIVAMKNRHRTENERLDLLCAHSDCNARVDSRTERRLGIQTHVYSAYLCLGDEVIIRNFAVSDEAMRDLIVPPTVTPPSE